MIIDLNVKGKDIVIVGGGNEAFRKVKALVGQDCNITIISNSFDEQLLDLIKHYDIDIIKQELKDASILDNLNFKPYMVLAATDDKSLNRLIVDKAKRLGALAYAADDPSISDFIHPAVINIKDTVFIAISTKGASPAMARLLRIKLEKALDDIIKDEDLELIRLAEFVRSKALSILKSQEQRKRYLYSIIENEKIRDMIKNNKLEEAKKEAMAILERWN